MTTFVVEDDHRWAEFDLEVKDTTGKLADFLSSYKQ